jgi:hypothetical protein
MARRDFEEAQLYRGTLGGSAAELVGSQIDLAVVKRIKLSNRSGSTSVKATIFVTQGSDTLESDGQYLFKEVEIEPNGWVEWHGWHVLGYDPDDDLFEQVRGYATGDVDCFIDGAILEAE